GDRLTICDWKTFPQPENPNYLCNHWQTKLYLYVLAETTDFAPENLSMTYWFVKLPNKPESFTVKYSPESHAKTRQELDQLLTRLQHSMDDYFRANIPLQHPDQQPCKCCPPELRKRRSPAILAGKGVDAFLNDIVPIEL
ncbi:MAG: PD-(D/E)XK nuclease family protein, partial [Limnothrix sp. RL_2_0]|nr:PD-(D/E)XK nuclease family protein [Limnothrix sp. RL_2_0]